ncbi:MAG: hypothetical protein U9Q29_07085 [Campylobacterota bacterium]|nr:hypothetical protein [Campylobacterota bacterium]
MKLGKLFKKAEKFFGMGRAKQEENGKKKKKLENSLEKKITSMKGKIKDMTDISKKNEAKKELEVLQKLHKKLLKK